MIDLFVKRFTANKSQIESTIVQGIKRNMNQRITEHCTTNLHLWKIVLVDGKRAWRCERCTWLLKLRY